MIRMLVAALVLLMAGTAVAADFKTLSWNFDGDKPGSLPAGFAPGASNGESGRWEVTADPKSSSPPNVLARVGSDQAANDAQVIFIEGAEAGDLDLTARIKAVSARNGEGGGIVFRAQDARNYYVVWLSTTENLVRLDRVVDGKQIPLQDLKVDNAEVGKWHSLRLSIRGPLLEALYDNRQPLSAREDAWEHHKYPKGKIGLWAKGASVTYFDNVRFTSMDGGTGSAPLGGTETTIIK